MSRLTPTPRLLFVEGCSRAELVEQIRRGDTRPSPSASAPHRLALVAGSDATVRELLAEARSHVADPSRRQVQSAGRYFYFDEPLGPRGKVAFLFPGDGAGDSALPGRLARWVTGSRWFRCVEAGLGLSVSRLTSDPLQAEVAGWLVFAHSLGSAEWLAAQGVTPHVAAGHSFGQWSALVAMGHVALEDDELIECVRLMNRDFREVREEQKRAGAASAWGVTPQPAWRDRVLESHRGDLFLAADNSPHHFLLGGRAPAIEAAVAALRQGGAIAHLSAEPMAPHTPLFADVARRLSASVGALEVRAGGRTVYSFSSAAPLPAESEAVRQSLVRMWGEPVRFRETIEAMYADGVRIFVDVGPRGMLAGFVEDTLRGRAHAAVSVDAVGASSAEQMTSALALLGAHGVPLGTPAPASPAALSSAERPPRPFLRGPVRAIPGGVVVECRLDAEEDLFLASHAFGGQVSRDRPELRALAVVPFAATLEMLAEAALALEPDAEVIGLRDVWAHKWMALGGDGALALRLVARPAGRHEVRVEIRSADGDAAAPLAEGTVRLGEHFPRAPPPLVGATPGRPTALRSRQILYEGPFRDSFQGPVFRTVERIERASGSGGELILRAPALPFFRTRSTRGLVLDPVLLEAVGQVTYCCVQRRFDRWVTSFPCRVGALDLFGPLARAGDTVRCRVVESGTDGPLARWQVTLADAEGGVFAEMSEWVDWTFAVPPRFRTFYYSPLQAFLSVPAVGGGPGSRRLSVFEHGLLQAMDGFWLRVLRDLVLSAEERRRWTEWGATDDERADRLLERIVAKEALRGLRQSRTGEIWGDADIALVEAPSVSGHLRFRWEAWEVVVTRHGGELQALATDREDSHAV